MARINFPNTFSGWVKLFRTVKPKVIALPVPNAIDYFLTEQNISLVNDETKVDAAVIAHDLFEEQEKEGEKLTEKGKKTFKEVWSDHRDAVQFLKSLYRSAPHTLGEWGVTVNGTNRIKYPPDFGRRKKCVGDFIAKHNTYAAGTSPLQPFLDENEIDLADNTTDTAAAVVALAAQRTAYALKEEKREERDNLINPVISHVRGIGAVAVAWYSGAPKKAGDLGFVIDDAPRAAKLRTITLQPGEERACNNLKVGGMVSLLGDGVIKIKPNTKIKVPEVELTASQLFKIGYGYGKSIFKNMSTINKVSITAEFHP